MCFLCRSRAFLFCVCADLMKNKSVVHFYFSVYIAFNYLIKCCVRVIRKMFSSKEIDTNFAVQPIVILESTKRIHRTQEF